VALNVGPDFKQRWLNVPNAIREAFIDDLSRVCDVLLPETPTTQWLEQDQKEQRCSFEKIEVAYAERKAELIEAARIRKQRALEKALEQKRAAEQAYADALKQDEERQFAAQTQLLAQMTDTLALEMHQHLDRYGQNPSALAGFAAGLKDGQMRSELENIRVRLELEAEMAIEEALKGLRKKLKLAAQEEIDYLLEHHTQQTMTETETSLS
jgi:hypothetical protein